jgi:Flp pilus assembly protein TadD
MPPETSSMRQSLRDARPRASRLLASATLAAVLALGLAGCKTTSDITGSIGRGNDAPVTERDWRDSLETWGERYKADPSNAEAAINYARALRATDQRAQAVAVLEQAAIRNPNNMPVLGAYGRALAAAGNYQQALDVLGRAHTPDSPDWRILNAQGAVLDQMGRGPEAQRHYSAALKIVPDEPSVLSNLGLSYVLTKDLKRAEITLRRALAQPNADPKVRQNLALVLGLRGKHDEAERVAGEGLPPDQAAANVANLRQVLAQQQKGGRSYVPPPNAGG